MKTEVIDSEVIEGESQQEILPAHQENSPLVAASDNMMSIIERVALAPDTDILKLEKMLELQERYEAKEAKKSFYRALSGFQTDIPVIRKQKIAEFPINNGADVKSYKYASLDDICEAIRPHLDKHGLTYRFEQSFGEAADYTKVTISVNCIVSHKDGHSESTKMVAFPDTSGRKNPIQSQASSITYLRRYTLTGALGIATADEDIDGRLPESIGGGQKQLAHEEGDGKYTQADFDKNFPEWKKRIEAGQSNANHIIKMVSAKGELSTKMKQKLNSIKKEEQ